ncbi:MAG: hypothetical protein JWM34_4893 [Ilumatobacteraceae bacterium]|nr:hypothetical protein [Ilumatobacteraceae bacterium]
MSFQVQPPPAKGARHKGLLVLGIVLLVGGIGAGVALFVAAGSQYSDAVKSLQRAPVGCDTEFDFTGTGKFIFYAETTGKVGDLRGDCDNTGTSYHHDGKVTVDLAMTNADGDDVKLDRATGASYDKAGFVGSEVRAVTIDKPGRYTLTVQSDDTDFAIAVGRNPKDDADKLQNLGVGIAAIGVVLGGLFILLGLRRKSVPAAPAGYGQPGAAPNAYGYNPAGYPPVGYPPAAPTSPPGWTPAPPPGAPPIYGDPAAQPAPQPYQQPYQQPGPPAAPPVEPPNPWGAPQQ